MTNKIGYSTSSSSTIILTANIGSLFPTGAIHSKSEISKSNAFALVNIDGAKPVTKTSSMLNMKIVPILFR
jgi:hypothetical protein